VTYIAVGIVCIVTVTFPYFFGKGREEVEKRVREYLEF
jgi:hypothetical protein